MKNALDESYFYCTALTRRTASNFYYSFLTLPKDLFQSMCAIYAFMRVTDDLSDDESVPIAQRIHNLNSWRAELHRAFAGEVVEHTLFPALVKTVANHQIPKSYFDDVLTGVELDLKPTEIETFAELENYCYHVAGVVGLCCIHIWGFSDERAKECAIQCGKAFQMTNILRDLKEDSERGRVYLPALDLAQFDYTREDLMSGCQDERFRELMAFEFQRTRNFYQEAEFLFDYLDSRGSAILETMMRIYGDVLNRIERENFDVFSQRIHVPTWKKLFFAGKAVIKHRLLGWLLKKKSPRKTHLTGA